MYQDTKTFCPPSMPMAAASEPEHVADFGEELAGGRGGRKTDGQDGSVGERQILQPVRIADVECRSGVDQVGHERIAPSVIVEVKESYAETRHPHAQRTHAARRGHFLEAFPGRVLPYWKGLVLQRRGYQVRVFVVVEIAKIQPHSGYEAAVFRQRHAFLKRDFLELVAQVVKQKVIRTVIGDEQRDRKSTRLNSSHL